MWGLSATAHADGLADEADLQFQLGAERYRNGDFLGALEHFLASNRLVPNRNVMFNVARSYEQLQRFPDAHRYYIDALDGETNPRIVADIEAALARLAPNVAVLDVQTTPPGATLYIDRRDLGSRGRAPRALAFPAGRYRVIAELDGYEPAVSEPQEVRNGAITHVTLALRRIVGTVRIDGETGASVQVDDERAPSACHSPCSLDLSPGAHTLFFSREGFQVQPRQVTVVARETVGVRASLNPLTGSVVVGSDERDALVEIDGRSVGFTPVVVPNVPVGRRTVRVTLRGFAPVERVVTVRAGQQVSLADLRLLPVREVTAASRVAESIDDAPSSVSVISAQELQAFAYPTIAEALRGTRGVYLSNDHAYTSAGIRGLGQPNDYGNRLLVLSDGQPLNDNILNSSYIGYDGRADLGDVERIEVVRGPGSLLYGTGAMSGVVNLVMRGRDNPTSVQGQVSTYDNAVARARAGFNLNLGRDRGVWASVAGARSDGQDLPVDSIDPMTGASTRQTVRGADAFLAGTTAGRAWWGPLTAQWLYTSRDQVVPVGAYGTLLGDQRTRWVDTRGMFELRYEPRLSSAVQLLTRVHANRYNFHGAYAYDSAQQPSVENYEGVWFGGEARVIVTAHRAARITAGAEAQVHPIADMTGVDGSGASYLNEHRPYNVFAGYALLEGSLTNWFRYSAGARVDVYSTFGATVNPRAALIFRPAPGGVLKFMGGRAFRAPSIYELYYNDGGATQLPAGVLRPEVIYTAEVEYSQRFAQDWVALGAVHASYFVDAIDTVAVPGMEDKIQYANGGAPIGTLGGDVELRREFRQGWMLSAMYGVEVAQQLTGPQANEQLSNAPMHLGSLRAVVPIIPSFLNGAFRLAAESGRRITGPSQLETPPSAIADLVLSGTVQRYGIRYAAGVYNLFDWRYSVPVTETFSSRYQIQNGRTFMANLSLTY